MSRACKVCGEEKPLELFVKNGKFRKRTCKSCDSRRVCAQQKANPEATKRRQKAWRQNNPERAKEGQRIRTRRYADNHPGVMARNVAKSASRPEARARAIEYRKERNQEPRIKAMSAANSARRRAIKLQATPSWANHAAIDFFYVTAQYMTESMQYQWDVDHVVPLRGEAVRGLHTHHNLRVIPHIDNMQKSNKLEQLQ